MTDEPTMSGSTTNEPTPDEYDEIGRRMLGRARRGERRRRAIQFAAVGISAAALTAAVLLPSTLSAVTVDDGSGLRSAQQAEAESTEAVPESGSAGEKAAVSGDGSDEEMEMQNSGGSPAILCYAEADPSAERVALSGDPTGDEEWAVEACDRIWVAESSPTGRGTMGEESSVEPSDTSFRPCRVSGGVIAVFPDAGGERNAELCEEIGGETPR
ncbi:hypothetical protein J4H92_08980 [Leucobacter weissii]|uniref:Uncharacterized protein n=1 Tax=Leucobacter weissii TaxID=1983706 RepID=A0A939MJV1_9MICO|nr:hypothetical protein [Leucobacter weissii]MBO1902078.1 hypothetical protein [Leucobacter weissii]